MKIVSSRGNPLYRALLRLKESPRGRRAERIALLDGAHLVAAFVECTGGRPRAIAVTADAERTREVASLLRRMAAIEPVVLSEALFKTLSPVATPTGILAAVDIPEPQPVPDDASCCLVLEDIQDPGNLGSMLRSAAAAGAGHALLSKGCADPWSPRVLRSAMGAHFLLNISERVDLVAFARSYRGQIVATVASGKKSIFELDLTPATAFVVGNEGAGLSRALLGEADAVAAIPMPGRMESINVGAAAAVCLFERVRQLAAVGQNRH